MEKSFNDEESFKVEQPYADSEVKCDLDEEERKIYEIIERGLKPKAKIMKTLGKSNNEILIRRRIKVRLSLRKKTKTRKRSNPTPIHKFLKRQYDLRQGERN